MQYASPCPCASQATVPSLQQPLPRLRWSRSRADWYPTTSLLPSCTLQNSASQGLIIDVSRT
ncbi:hypothetical protein DL95DRAFT_394232 [Leptodontidium sp. 2 PMI_412]|nr:hypothetical protein DL95DRAFT_394232 [Leptodontidium sp. 2 PMI_412]